MTKSKNITKSKLIKKSIIFFSVIILVVGIFSCPNISLFQGFDSPNTAEISELTGDSLLEALKKNVDSKIFYKKLTISQRETILSNLDNIIEENKPNEVFSENGAKITQAASFAINLLINTDALCYAVIYNLVDPVIVVITEKNVTPESIFSSYTEPLEKTIEVDKTTAEEVISQCFYNLYRITAYYNLAVYSAVKGSYSGGDLQKYLVSGLVSGVVSGTISALNSSSADLVDISNTIAEAFIEAEKETVSSVLSYLFQEISQKFGVAGANIGDAYKEELLGNAKILGIMAGNAGYENLSQAAIEVLERWGS